MQIEPTQKKKPEIDKSEQVEELENTQDEPSPKNENGKSQVESPNAKSEELPASARINKQKLKLKKSRALPSKEDLLREMEEEKKTSIVQIEEIKGESPFTLEQVREKWNEFLEYKKENGGMETEIMVLRQPWELNNHVITLHLTNAIQQDLFIKFQSDLVGFLRRQLDNRNIEVRNEIKEELRQEMLYTNSEKFEHLKKVNPTLKDLSERLGLDPEF